METFGDNQISINSSLTPLQKSSAFYFTFMLDIFSDEENHYYKLRILTLKEIRCGYLTRKYQTLLVIITTKSDFAGQEKS